MEGELVAPKAHVQYLGDMNEDNTASAEARLYALGALQADFRELERVEGLLERVNVFEIRFIAVCGRLVESTRYVQQPE